MFSLFPPATVEKPTTETTLDLYIPKPVSVPLDKMVDLVDWQQETGHELVLAHKPGLPIPYFPIFHVAIGFHNPQSQNYAIYGRRIPYDWTQWLRTGFSYTTPMENENLSLQPSYSFSCFPSGVCFSKTEIHDLLRSADQMINQSQQYALMSSNCVSYVVTCLAFALEALLNRPDLNSYDMARLISLTNKEFLTGDFGPGIFNNEKVGNKLKQVFTDVLRRMQTIETVHRSDYDNYCISTLCTLMPKLQNTNNEAGSCQYRNAN